MVEASAKLLWVTPALSDLAGVADPRLIDGILLTKFDTIDDKVTRLRQCRTR